MILALQLIDLCLTLVLIRQPRFAEANIAIRFLYETYGDSAVIAYKVLLVGLLGILLWRYPLRATFWLAFGYSWFLVGMNTIALLFWWVSAYALV